jgi:thiol-disulfide isomerase/thioredoxin
MMRSGAFTVSATFAWALITAIVYAEADTDTITSAIIEATRDADPDVRLTAYRVLTQEPVFEGAAKTFRDGLNDSNVEVQKLTIALKVSKWLQGDAVEKFESGQIYVVDFWAPWCAPCIGNMVQLTELQSRYKDKGVTIIGITARDIRDVPNSEDQVTAFVESRGTAFGYPLGYADDETTADVWLKAAGQRGFCTFVVDKTGRIAYLGHPMFLDLVLLKVTAGASASAVGDEMAKVVEEYVTKFDALTADFQAGRDLKPGLDALMRFEARYPPLTDLLPVVQAKLSLLPQYANPGEAKDYAEAIVTKGIEKKDVRLLNLAYSILRDGKGIEEYPALAVMAAEACVHIDGGKDPRSLFNLADAYLVAGDAAKANEYAGRAIEAAAGEPPDLRADIEERARRLGGRQCHPWP